ncbi:MAG: tyrosine-type recombinase/integrase [Bacteroidia bacterium]|nr:tyrosine-type recombinase/integrase [Bacteroidia bacterium]
MNLSDAFFIYRFQTYLEAEKKMSAHTVKAYISDINALLIYLQNNYEVDSVNLINHHHIKSWLSDLMAAEMDPRSVNRKISSLKTYYKYLLKHALVEIDPMIKVTSPKNSKKLPVFISEDNMNNLVDSLIDEKDDEINDENDGIATDILLTLYHTGIRLSELIYLEKQNIDLYAGTLKVLGKRNKERIIPMSGELQSALLNRLKLHPASVYVFNTPKGNKLYPNYVYRLIKNLLTGFTTQKKKSPHVLRHTFATHLLNNGGDLNAIKELLGHANLSATQIYTHNSVERLKKIHQLAHPKSGK